MLKPKSNLAIYVYIVCMSLNTPTKFIARFKLYAKKANENSPRTLSNPFIKQ
jgi:hypothetical protein